MYFFFCVPAYYKLIPLFLSFGRLQLLLNFTVFKRNLTNCNNKKTSLLKELFNCSHEPGTPYQVYFSNFNCPQ